MLASFLTNHKVQSCRVLRCKGTKAMPRPDFARARTLVLLCLFLLTSQVIAAQGMRSVSLVSRSMMQWKSVLDIVLDGDYAYLGTAGSGVRVVDITNPQSIKEVGYYWLGDGVSRMILKDNLLYVNSGYSVICLDISDPVQPQMLGTICSYVSSTTDFDIDGDHLYVCYDYHIITFNIADPANPWLVATAEPDWNGTPWNLSQLDNIRVKNSIAYLSCDDYGFAVLDLSEPGIAHYLGSCQFPQGQYYFTYTDIEIDGNLAYVSRGDVLTIFNIDQSFIPSQIGSVSMPDIRNFTLQGNEAFVTTYDAHYRVDVSNPALPQIIDIVDDPKSRNSTWVGNKLYVSDDAFHPFGGLRILDVQEPGNPQYLGSYIANWYLWRFGKTGDFLYVVSPALRGVHIIDVSEPEAPEIAGNIVFGDYIPSNLVIDNGRAAFQTQRPLGDGGSGAYDWRVRLYDLSDPLNPQPAGILHAESFALDIENNILACMQSQIKLWDISNIHDPQLMSTYTHTGEGGWQDMILDGSYLYILKRSSLEIVDISDIANPQQISLMGGLINARFMDKYGSKLYIAEEYGLRIVSVSDPANAFLLSFTPSNFSPVRNISVRNGICSVAHHPKNINVYDVSNPSNPVLLDSLTVFNQYVCDLKADGDLLYVTEFTSLLIYSCDPVSNSDPVLPSANLIGDLICFPNPFVDATNISFGLKAPADLAITIYNVRGQKIKDISSGFLGSGKHSFGWDGKDGNGRKVSSGIYMIKLSSGNTYLARRVLLLK
ncbi:MAG: beta-propeller domain-containing protein [Candidatus Cloacimonadaceae bacterium]|jgi:hypothetical protein|nr:beta-propeller domain-containing protein [Candidatus Cloacimonadota bacterium]MDX9949738.1 beta-propeller domain-containing protein [Candidatus Syntrophosphaera sp.]